MRGAHTEIIKKQSNKNDKMLEAGLCCNCGNMGGCKVGGCKVGGEFKYF